LLQACENLRHAGPDSVGGCASCIVNGVIQGKRSHTLLL
jgi:hypothetical protein